MSILKWRDFLVFESKIHFFPELEQILSSMKSPIAKKMMELSNKDINTLFNYLNISDRDDLVSFIPDNKVLGDNNVEYKFATMPYYIVDSIQIRKIFGVDHLNGMYPRIGCLGTIKNRIPAPNDEFEARKLGTFMSQATSDICHFVSLSGETYIVLFENLEDQNKLVTDIKSIPIKIGRLVKSFLSNIGIEFPDTEYDKFVTEYKSMYELLKNKFSNFEVVFGEEIRKFYLHNRYDNTRRSILQNSCMRYQKCQPYFDIYVENPEVCSMVIRRSFIDSDLITARALLWKLSDGSMFMDRVYYSREQEQNLFESWAIDNGYYYQNRDQDFRFDGKKADIDPEVNLKKYKFDYYPYLDTFKYLDPETGILYENVDEDIESRCYFLESQDGDIEP